ncbi:MAG: ORF6N domain-containing protein [Aliarcobacter sp.]
MKDICVQKKDDPRILVIRGQKVILDQDLARIYEVTTSALNQAIRRNAKRFPDRFLLIVTRQELRLLISQNVISKIGRGGATKPPMAFTEHGALMVASVLNSARAISMSIYVIEAFIKQREELATSEAILKRLAEIDRSLMVHDEALQDLYNKLLPLLQVEPEAKQRAIGFGV